MPNCDWLLNQKITKTSTRGSSTYSMKDTFSTIFYNPLKYTKDLCATWKYNHQHILTTNKKRLEG